MVECSKCEGTSLIITEMNVLYAGLLALFENADILLSSTYCVHIVLKDTRTWGNLKLMISLLQVLDFLHASKLIDCYTLCVIFQKGQYTYLFFAIVKVVIMMTGELDFEDAFYGDDGPSLAFSAIFGQFVFLLLVFITTIVLLNLLTGLAVNDVQVRRKFSN